MRKKAPLAGIVLAGGQSSRMGRDKASLPWGDSDLLHTVLKALAPVCCRLIVVSNTPREIGLPGVNIVADQHPGCGPLGGIHAGLAVSECEYNFIVACDMPYINGQAIDYLAGVAKGYDVTVPFIDNHYHPLHAVYHQRCFPFVEALLGSGRYRIIDFYNQIALRRVDACELASFDPEGRMLNNLNYPDDLPEKI